MTEPMPTATARRPPRSGLPAAGLVQIVFLALLLASCVARPSPTPTPRPTASPSPIPTAGATPGGTPSATPEPPLSLALPPETDPRQVSVGVDPQVPADGDGQLVVTVTNLSDERVAELVLRWASGLDQTLFLAPFKPSQQRIANGGPPLVQPWTKWVVGPGERGEPAGTTSLGWGPLDPGATLTIPILVTRRAAGDVAFDLQVLAGEAILTLEDGRPAELRVSVP
ncbi:MAG TPA: hypothetical protein VF013_07320 [Candidatus Limnocylindria bacterium]